MSLADTAAEVVRRWLPAIDARLAVATGGHVNRSFFVSDGAAAPRWLLQQVNSHVFPEPLQVMRNIELVLDAARNRRTGIDLPTLLRTTDEAAWVIDADGGLWRCWLMAPGLVSAGVAPDIHAARETARAFGAFASCMVGANAGSLVETIPGFHTTPRRLAALEASIRQDAVGRVEQARETIAAALARRELAPQLVAPLQAHRIPLRVVHNDAKVANVLFDRGGNATDGHRPRHGHAGHTAL